MDFDLTGEQRELFDAVVDFSRKELNDGVAARDRDQQFSRDLWKRCGSMGLPGLPVPAQYGGTGLDPQSCAAALEAFGYGCEDGGLVFSVCAHLLACVVPLWKHGNDTQRKRLLPGLCDGTLIAVNAMTEEGTGSDAFAMKTHAVPDGDGFRIRGRKIFCSNGPVADLALVYALTDPSKGYHGGVTAFIVEAGSSGFSVGQSFEKMGLRTSPFGELLFDDVQVGPEAVLGRVGAGAQIFSQSMDWERALLGACHIGTMQRLLERSIAHARTRRQYGQVIAHFQAVSHKLADMKVRLQAARLLVYFAASRLHRARDASLDASVAKLFVSESLLHSALDTVQLMGGYGFTVDYEVERMLRDAVGSTIYSGTSEIQRNIIARWMGL